MLSRVAISVLVQNAETLARWPADDDISLRDLRRRIAKNIYDVTARAVSSKVRVIRVDCKLVEVIRPHRVKGMPERLGKTERHSPGTGKHVDQAVPLAFPAKGTLGTSLVDPFFLADKPRPSFLDLVFHLLPSLSRGGRRGHAVLASNAKGNLPPPLK